MYGKAEIIFHKHNMYNVFYFFLQTNLFPTYIYSCKKTHDAFFDTCQNSDR